MVAEWSQVGRRMVAGIGWFVFICGVIMVIRLKWQEAEKRVFVSKGDEDCFAKVIQAAARASYADENSTKFDGKFRELLKYLTESINTDFRQFSIKDVYLTIHRTYLLFVLVTDDMEYNCDLEDRLSDLELAVARNPDFSLICLSALCLPPVSSDSMSSFLNSDYTLVFPHI